jgi:hypothetical protein
MSRKWCAEMLRRSGNYPLEIIMRVTGFSGSYPATSSLDLARELMRPEHSTRLAGVQLELSSLARNDVELLIQSLQQSAPLLASLDLRQASWEPMTIGSLASCLPSLRRLALYNVFLSPWVSPILDNLHELHINFDRHRLLHLQDTLPSYGEVATILGRMSELRHLELRNVFAEGTHTDAQVLSGRTISLQKLRRLTLIDQQECDLLSFATLLNMPSTTCAEIKSNGFRAWNGPSHAAHMLFSRYECAFGHVRRLKLLANCRRPQVTLEFRASDALSIESSAPSQLRLEYVLPALPPTTTPTLTRGGAPADVESPLPLLTPLSTPCPIARHFGDSALCLDGLVYLEVVSHAATSTSVTMTMTAAPASESSYSPNCWWAALFSRATQVQQIRATYRGAVDGLIAALLVQHQHDSERLGQPRPLVLFPELRGVKLSLVDLDEETVIAPGKKQSVLRRGDVLLDCLARRRALGIGIRELEVPSDRGERWVRRLREIVPVVVHAEI